MALFPPQGAASFDPATDQTITGDWTFSGAVVFSGSVTTSADLLFSGGTSDIGSATVAEQPRYGYFSSGLVIGDAGATTIPAGSLGTFHLYKQDVTTTASNYERLTIRVSGQSYQIYTNQAGGGSARVLEFGTGGVIRFKLDAAAGHLLAQTDATYDIGASGANRPRRLYLGDTYASGGTDDRTLDIAATLNDSGAAGGSDVFRALKVNITETDTTGWDSVYLADFQVGGTSKFSVSNAGVLTTAGAIASLGPIAASSYVRAGSDHYLYWSSRSRMSSPADGAIRMTNLAQTDFSYLDLAGASAELRINGTKVVDSQQPHIADATDAASVIARLNDLLAALETHGLLASS